jgi:hypothetical protein
MDERHITAGTWTTKDRKHEKTTSPHLKIWKGECCNEHSHEECSGFEFMQSSYTLL